MAMNEEEDSRMVLRETEMTRVEVPGDSAQPTTIYLHQNADFPPSALNSGISGDRKQTAQYLASENIRVTAVEVLIAEEADSNAKDANSETPSHCAAQRGHLEIVKPLIEKGQAEIDVPDDAENTALHEAVISGHFSTVKYLVKSGADVNSKDRTSVFVLSYAVQVGSLMMVHFLVENGAEIHVEDANGVTPLRRAVDSGQWDVVKYLVERGAELSRESGALKKVVEEGQWPLATLLIENGAPTKDLTEEEISEVLKKNSISSDGKEDVISGLMILGNAQLLENYVNNNSEKNLEQVLPRIYQEIQLLNVHLSPSVSLFVESYIIKSRLFSNKIIIITHDENGDQKTEVKNNILERINLVVAAMENLERINSTLESGNEMSDVFLFTAKFIARNMQTLKYDLRFTVVKLPWTEMQFCLINFISSFCGSRPKNMDFISSLIVNKTRLMQHLTHFKHHLENLETDLKFDRRIKFAKRKDLIASVLRSSPDFRSLYEDYEALRDVYSLNRVASYLHVASAMDVEKEDGLVSEQVILRALQVTGECLKNTEESPNMSDHVHRLLMAMAPTNIKDIVTSLRDSLSHVEHLHKKNGVPLPAVPKDRKWLLGIQKDVMKLEYEINFQLLLKKDLAVKTFFRRIFFDCDCIEKAKEIIDGVGGTLDAEEPEADEFHHQHVVIHKVIELIEKFKGVVEMPTEYQRQYLRNLELVLELLKARWEKLKRKHALNVSDVKALISSIQDVDVAMADGGEKEMDLIRKKAGCRLSEAKFEMKNETNLFDELVFNIGSIYDSLGEADRLLHNQLHAQIFDLIEFEAKRADSIDKLNSQMEGKSNSFDDDESQKMTEQKVEEILREIANEISIITENNAIGKEFLALQIDNKKELFRWRNQLMAFYDRIVRMYAEIYDNCVDVYNILIKSFQRLCDCLNPKLSDFNDKNQLIIKLIAENELDQLLSELNLKTFIDEIEFKNVLKKIQCRELTNIEEIFLDKNKKSPIDKLLIDELHLNFNNNEKSIRINFKKVFEILVKNSKKKVDLMEKNGKNRKKDEVKVAEVINTIELGQSIEQIKLDLSKNEESFSVLAFDKALNLSSEKFLLRDFSFSNCKYLKQNLPKFNTYGKLVKEVSEVEAEIGKWIHPFKKFILSLNIKLTPEIANQAVENVFQKWEKQRKVRLKKFFSHKLEILTQIFPTQKTDLQLLDLLKNNNNNNIRLSVEILLLNLTETLENLSLLEPNRLYLDEICPVLVGKNLRNYLAHGDPLINVILSTNHSLEISLINHFRLFQQHRFSSQSDFFSGQFLIGKRNPENVEQLADNYNHSRAILIKKYHLLSINKNTEIEDLKKLIDKPIYLNVRSTLGDTLLHYSAFAKNLSLFQHLFDLHGFSPFIENGNGHTSIHVAIASGSEQIIAYLLESGFDPSFIVADGNTLLHLAVHFGHLNIVRLLLSHNADTEAVNNEGNAPIVEAVTFNHRTILLELLNAGSDPNSRNKNGKTLAHLANAEILELLLEKDVNLSALDRDLFTPLHSACYKGDEGVVAMLLANHVDVISGNRDGFSPIHIAACEGHLKIVQLLIEKNIELVDIQTFKKSTPLYFACFFGHVEMVKLLIAKGADVNSKGLEDMTALHVATTMGHLEVMDILLDADRAIDSVSNGMTVLDIAAKGGLLEAFKKLVARGADVSLSAGSGNDSVLHLAAYVENLQLLEFILATDKSLMESVDSRGQTALHHCALYNRLNALNFLIKSGANLEARDQAGNTPLLTSAFKGHSAIFSTLLSNGAAVEVENEDNWSAVHCAAQNNNFTIMKWLIERKMNLNARKKDGFSAVHLAAQNGHLEMLKILVENGAQIDLRGFKAWSALHFAALNDHQRIIGYLVKKKPELVSGLSADNVAPLHFTAGNGNVSCVTLLIDKGADIYAKTTSEWTALHFAAEKGHSKTAEILLNRAQKNHHPVNTSVSDFINARNNSGLTATQLSARNGHFDVLNTLLQHAALVNIGAGGNNDTALHLASGSGQLACVQLLIENGADVNATNVTNCTPLHFAAEEGFPEIVNILLNSVVEIDCKTDLKVTPLHLSAQNGHLEVVRQLLEHNSDVNALDENKYTPLHYASSKGHHQIVDLLLKNNAATDVWDCEGFSALHLAAKDGHKLAVEAIVSNHIDAIDFPTEEDLMTALHFAAGNNHADVVEILLHKGANINAKTDTNWTALLFAIEKGHSKIIEILLDRGCCVNYDHFSPPLHLAINKDNVLIAGILINKGAADVNAINEDESTGLHVACAMGNLNMVELLINSGAETNCKAKCGLTPLHMAAFNAHSDIVEILVNNGAHINEKMEGGGTALHWAVKYGHLNVVDALLSFAADANAADETHETPLHVAVDLNLMDIAEVLIGVGGADVYARDWHDTVLHKAVRHEEMLEMVLREIERRTETEVWLRRAVLNAGDNEGDSPLMWAAEQGRLGAVRLLLAREEVEVDMRNDSGATAVHWAVLNGHREVVEALVVDGKAQVDVRNNEGESAFDLAMKHVVFDENYESIAAFLLSFAS